MLKSEKKSFIRFLSIYLSSTFLLFALASVMFYNYEKEHLIDKQKEMLSHKAQRIITELRKLHDTFHQKLKYPQFSTLKSAIYDLNKQYIMGTYQEKESIDKIGAYIERNQLFYISHVEPYYLGAAYLLVTQPIDFSPMQELKRSIWFFMLIAAVVFTILGVFLGRLFIQPMRESMEKMNKFIEDTTHELNMPISTILNNIEILESSETYVKSEELSRIEIASKTLSRIYDDLTFLNFKHQYHRNIEYVNISSFIDERILYFSALAEGKLLHIEANIEPDVYIYIDKNDLLRLIDNLFSNAIKYNVVGGEITVDLNKKSLIVSDTGIGMSQQEINVILQRFKRVNQSEGGFGIGLDIINQIVSYYGFILQIKSEKDKGTSMEIRWVE